MTGTQHHPDPPGARSGIWLAVPLAMLWPQLTHAGTGEPASLAQALDTADLFQEEYRQDLATAISDAQKQVAAAAPGTARALSLTLEARIRRLRGEYSAADACLDRAEREPAVDAMTRVRILVERDWNQLDRFRTPWGSVDPTTDDVACVRPGLGQDHVSEGRWARAAIDAIPAADPAQRQAIVNRAMAIRDRGALAWSAAQNRSLMTTSPTLSRGDVGLHDSLLKLSLQMLDQGLLGAQKLDPLPADRAALLRSRLAIPLVTLARSPANGDAYVACDQPAKQVRASDRRLDGQELLLCAERALFPLASPETLGRHPLAPTTEDSTYRIASDAWSSEELARNVTPQTARNGLQLLAEAEARFRAANNRRGMARIAFVRGAVALASAVDDAGPALALEPLTRAIELAMAAGDRVLAQRGQILLAGAQALTRDRAAALRTLRAVLDDTRQNHSFGTGLGGARVLAALAAHAAFIRAEPSSAELLNELAMDLFAAGGVVGEAAHLPRRQALIQASVGRLLAARTTLTDALARPRPCSQGNVVDGLLAELELRDKLAELALDSSDAAALERELVAIEAAVRRLVPDLPRDASTAQLIALAQRAHERAEEIRQATNVKLSATRDPVAQRRIEEAATIEQRQALDRMRALASVPLQRSLLDVWWVMLQHLRDRAAIVEDPDLPANQYYLETERRAHAIRLYGAELRALVAAKRGDRARARAIWLAEVPSVSARLATPDGSSLASAGFPEQVVRRSTLALSTAYAENLALIGAYDLADQVLQGVEREFGASWYLELQQPWTGMSTYVAVASGLGRHEQALAMARRMLDAIDGRRASLFDERFRLSLVDVTSSASVYGRVVEAAARAGQPREAMEFMERGKARSLQDRYASERAPAQRRLRELAQAVELLQSLADGARPGDPGMARMTAELTRRRAEYEAELRTAGLDTGAPGNLASVADRVSQLPSGIVVLDYFATSTSVTVIALSAGHAPILASTAVPGPVLEGLVRRLDSNLARRVRPDQVQGDAARLADLAFPPGPILQLVASPETRELVLVPHGVLHEIPFAFLPVAGAPLVVHATVREVPFADAAIAPRRARPGGAGKAPAAVFWHLGDDDGVPLLHAEAEARDIAALYGVRADPAPSRESLLAAMQTAHVVHLIAHGAASPTATGYARIDLPARSPADDGDLTVSDILLAGALSADAVVLSSCEMANGRRTPGDDGAGVARALLQKGVGTVIAPVWQIADVPQEVMRELHRGLERGESAAAALALAQRQAWKRGRHPAFWAGFVALGGTP
jgi:CHAT domain-containing protein